jgi:hypothetical protein
MEKNRVTLEMTCAKLFYLSSVSKSLIFFVVSTLQWFQQANEFKKNIAFCSVIIMGHHG